MLCKEIFKVHCVPAAAAAVAHTSVNLRARQLCWACSILFLITNTGEICYLFYNATTNKKNNNIKHIYN